MCAETVTLPMKNLVVALGLVSLLSVVSTVDCFGGEFPAANSSEVRAIRNQIRASQFLSHATFGPTQETIDELAGRIGQVGYRRACEEWIDQQYALPMTSHMQVARDMFTADGRVEDTQGVGMHLYRYQAWWHIALTAEDQFASESLGRFRKSS